LCLHRKNLDDEFFSAKISKVSENQNKLEKDINEEYDDDRDQELPATILYFSQILYEFLDKYEINGRKIVPKSEDTVQNQLEAIRQELGQVHINEQGSELKVTIYKKQAWDCQSILNSDGKKLLKNEESDSERQVDVAEVS
ncbi:6799_t:CDS:2, partial [Racocetra fulgida]